MISSLENAIPFFNKWLQERSRLEFIFTSRGVGFNFVGLLQTVSPKGITAVDKKSGATDVCLTLSFRAVKSFNFLDEREASELVRNIVGDPIESAWELKVFGGGMLAMYELRR